MKKMPELMVALVTPFFENGQIDYKSIINCIERCIQDGVEGIVLCGTTGECSTLTFEEKEELLRFTIRIVNKRMQVWMGCGTNNTATTLDLCMMAIQYAVDGIMLITPYYNRPSQMGLYEHFKVIAKKVPVPIMLYNVPKRTGVDIEAKTVIRLCNDFKNIVALKEASNDFKKVEKIVGMSDCIVYCGDDGALLEGLKAGMSGIVSVVGHLYAPLIRQIMNQYELGIEDETLMNKLKKITQACFSISSPSDIKALLAYNGLCKETVRLPLVPLDHDSKMRMIELLDNL